MKILYKLYRIIYLIIFVASLNYSYSQGLSSSIGDRENIGVFGGPASDLSFTPNNRLFASVNSPFTLFYSDDTAKTWTWAFPLDSIEYNFGKQGWGGGSTRVLTNNEGWVLAKTGDHSPGFSSAVVSYNNGDSFQTAFNPSMLQILTGEYYNVSAIGLSDQYCLVALGPYIVRTNQTTSFGSSQIILNINSIPGIAPGSFVSWLALSNGTSGLPYYFVVSQNGNQKGRLFKAEGTNYTEFTPPQSYLQFRNVFTHPNQLSGDTIFVSTFDTIFNEYSHYRSFTGLPNWTNITPSFVNDRPISDCDYSADWIQYVPQGDGIRLSMQEGIISDNLGTSWQGPGFGLHRYPIVTYPIGIDILLGSNNTGVAVSINGITGSFLTEKNIGFENLLIYDFATDQSVFYVATKGGLAFTSEYYNPLITGYNQWISPNGYFPVPGTAGFNGASSVAIDPFNSDHVICGNEDGFLVTTSGPNDFNLITPSNWNSTTNLDPTVTDIIFLNSNTILAVTGFKFQGVNSPPTQPVGNIWRSLNGGFTWNIVTPIFPNIYENGNCLGVGTAGGQTIVYSGTGINSPNYQLDGALWQSYDFGDTWQYVNDGPTFNSGPPLPIYDIEIDPSNNQVLYLAADLVLANSVDGGLSYFNTDVPYNTGPITSALIDLQYADSIYVTAGRNFYKYSNYIDDADNKFKGLPGEFFTSSSFGSVLGGSNSGAYKIVEAPTHFLDLIVFIEGAFNGTDMNTTLNTNGYLPLSQPFNQAPWFYSGTESVASIPSPDVVDWILIDLRKTTGDLSSATEATRFNRQAAFLLKDGSIVDDDGLTNPRFNIILENTKGNVKVQGVVYSPSHVGERSADSLSQAKNSYTFSYNFTSGPDQVWGGKNAHKEISPGVWGMISGDGNQDFQVDNTDKNEVWQPELGLTGYYFGDFNRDGTVDMTDLNDYWKPNSGSGAKIE
ncbi:MAG: hypothetical protein K9H58_12925 [Bacteroidales bacterium]|nr:hypothetical protein [Bacteroidales bacterium]